MGMLPRVASVLRGLSWDDEKRREMSDTARPSECPKCHRSDAVVPILYGLIDMNERVRAAAERGEFVLGGCSVSTENRYCKRCHQ